MELGVFGPEYEAKLSESDRQAYKEHMRIQMSAAKAWRKQVLGEDEVVDNELEISNVSLENDIPRSLPFPPLVACASDTIPTVNQILRRKRQTSTIKLMDRDRLNTWEYDYVNGRSVPGDGRIDFDKAFPPSFIAHKKITLDSAHAKQMCWEESGGSFGRVYQEVVEQITNYLNHEPSILVTQRTRSTLQFQAATQTEQKEDGGINRRFRRRIGRKILASKALRVREKIKQMRSRIKTKSLDRQLEVASRRLFSFRRKR